MPSTATASNTVDRESLLHALQSVQPGLSPREVRGQETCFAFKNGLIYTYNTEIACNIPSPLGKSFTGVIQSEKILEMLNKLTEESLEWDEVEGKLYFYGNSNRQVYFTMEKEIILPVDEIDKPKKWTKINDAFSEAVRFVAECAGKDESQFDCTCVHITPKFVEAHNNFQLCRWKMKTGFEKPILIQQKAIKHIAVLGLTEVSETESWIHFRGESGLVLSCRRFVMDYKSLDEIINLPEGEPTTFPPGLAETADKAAIMLDNIEEGGKVLVELKQNKLRLSSTGVRGGYREPKKVVYKGQPFSFYVSPKLLTSLLQKSNECFLYHNKEKHQSLLRITDGQYVYISTLKLPDEKEEDISEGEE